MILLSSHIDKVFHESSLSYSKGEFKGLLDNFIGVLATYLTLLDDKTLIQLERKGKLKIWHNTQEEWGLLDDTLPKLSTEDIVIVVDVCSSAKYNEVDFSLENISGFSEKEVFAFSKSLRWEGFKFLTGQEDEGDEAFYLKGKCKTIAFIIPIKAEGCGWHLDNATVKVETLLRSKQGLKRLISYLI